MNEEQIKKIEHAVHEILEAIGEDPNRPGLLETPKRVAKMYEEVFSGVTEADTTEYKIFDTMNDSGMVVIKDIEFYSMCEHHLLPFYGTAHVAYIPDRQRVIGLSKIPRIVEYAAKRPNLQENLTYRIAEMLAEKIQPKGVAVMLEADHMCMAMRGVRSTNTSTVTSYYSGVFLEDFEVKRDFLRVLKK